MGNCDCRPKEKGKVLELPNFRPDNPLNIHKNETNKINTRIICFYDVKDDNWIQIINDRSQNNKYINTEIQKK